VVETLWVENGHLHRAQLIGMRPKYWTGLHVTDRRIRNNSKLSSDGTDVDSVHVPLLWSGMNFARSIPMLASVMHECFLTPEQMVKYSAQSPMEKEKNNEYT